ncbi:hypothetical protein CEP51_012049 [Fusarium floridanum]|uniref:Uncharacterized protein n=1 Tax=Fusarium floridanum TaxID=1325733 RepID=A0A428R1Q6_9HYPO|nr:hypothetical protein CEP51_012049 [Fusarium floridanum]
MLRLAKMDTTGEAAKGPVGLAVTTTAPSDPKDKVDPVSQQNGDVQKGSVKDFQRLCVNLGLPGELGSKTKCRKVCQPQTRQKDADIDLHQEIKNVNVNIGQFLQSKNKPQDVKFFKDKRALVKYTKKTDSFYPKDQLPKGDPLRASLKRMFG